MRHHALPIAEKLFQKFGSVPADGATRLAVLALDCLSFVQQRFTDRAQIDGTLTRISDERGPTAHALQRPKQIDGRGPALRKAFDNLVQSGEKRFDTRRIGSVQPITALHSKANAVSRGNADRRCAANP